MTTFYSYTHTLETRLFIYCIKLPLSQKVCFIERCAWINARQTLEPLNWCGGCFDYLYPEQRWPRTVKSGTKRWGTDKICMINAQRDVLSRFWRDRTQTIALVYEISVCIFEYILFSANSCLFVETADIGSL